MEEPLTLGFKVEKTIEPTSPFNFDATLYKPGHFPSGDNAWSPGIRWQTMLWRDTPLGLVIENLGKVTSPLVRVSIFSDHELDNPFVESILRELVYRYNLHMDLTGFNNKFRDDPQLGSIIQEWLGMRPMHYGSLYEYLLIAIVLQNATVRRSVNMLQSLFENYGRQLAFDNKLLYCYWPPRSIHAAPEQELRDLKVGYRAKTIKRVSEAFVTKEIDEFNLRQESLENQRSKLLGLHGVGPASVGYILFDVFHQMDYLDHISPWEQKIYSRLFFETEIDNPVSTDELMAYFTKRFLGYRMLAVNYFWEDLFWKRKQGKVKWLEELIRL